MNHSDDSVKCALQQADLIQDEPFSIADIKGKARAIQRRRALATLPVPRPS